MKTRILIVDDKEENLYMLDVLLTGISYEVTQAENGKVAFEKANENPPDLIISDILMPVMDGFTLCKKWKTHKTLKHIPFVFYTATYTDAKDEEFALHLGADRFIIKPQDPDVFIAMIKEVLQKLKTGKYTPPSKPKTDEVIHLREYNQALIRKLEDKMAQAEETNKQLTEILNKYKTILNTAPDAIFILDEQGKITEANDQAGKLFGYSPADLLKLDATTLHINEDREKVMETIQLTKTRGSEQSEWKFKRKDGSVFYGSLRAKFTPGIGFHAIIRDVTDQKESEQKIDVQLNELRQWYNVTLGRENKMIELKREINQLLSELNRPKKYQVK